MKHYQNIVIGFGKGGKTLSEYLGSKGESVAMIEKSDKMYGGTCINVGCIPSKSLVTSGLKLKGKNLNLEERKIAYQEAISEKRRLTEMLREKNFNMLNNNENVTVFNGFGSFIAKNQVEVKTKTETFVIEGDRIFINTGSTPVKPPIDGIENNSRVFFSEGLMDLDEFPETLTIIGGGYIGLEFASMYSNFGSKVTIIQHGSLFLKRDDRDIADEIKSIFENKGIDIILDADISSISDDEENNKAIINYTIDGVEKNHSADAVLVATGRKANTEGLNLEAAGVETTSRGAVKTNEFLKTTNPNIWAMGDVVGGLQFTYISLDDFRIVKGQLEGNRTYNLLKRENVPFSVFIDPAFSRVGLTEEEAIKEGYNVKIGKLPAAGVPKAQVLKNPVGLLKAIVDKDTDKILGAELICEESFEVINIIKLVMDLNLDYTVLRDQVFTHPTMSEALNDLFKI
jgi:pyruvate/2-oxoglutarate dehydrogenase complex dihydrolipoamide dehydrogenase (E3) component